MNGRAPTMDAGCGEDAQSVSRPFGDPGHGGALPDSRDIVALDLGYDNPVAFTAMFKRSLGVSPRAYFQRAE
ncbi:helix-turn-helix domain-containing protein [Oceanibaculum pacificum]|uniref:helix-turn-helix domain-containing protein n=1 Tax=Oceanibaculum pacificum TaxID=580166 RepID=UPI001E2DB825|nr:helix-turn-helix domain-containing protein [Oceanibaculum pacificum]